MSKENEAEHDKGYKAGFRAGQEISSDLICAHEAVHKSLSKLNDQYRNKLEEKEIAYKNLLEKTWGHKARVDFLERQFKL
jgi:hypothetical protein